MKPKVLLVADIPNWAYDFRCNALWTHLGDHYEFAKAYLAEMPAWDYAQFEVLYYAGFMLPGSIRDRAKADRRKVVTSISGIRTRKVSDVKEQLEKTCAAAAAVNVWLYETFKGTNGVRVDLIQNGVDCDLFHPVEATYSSSDFVVGWAGRQKKNKTNIKRLDSLARVVASIPGMRLKVCSFDKRIPHEQMPDFYRSIDCYCCVSMNEGHSNTVSEAAACGVPIISTPVGTSTELIANGRGILVRKDLGDLGEALKMMMSIEPESRARMGLELRQYVLDNWDWKSQAPKYGTLFDYIMEQNR
jgi:glycosyltransferase involved in cell wall biosynthesis